MWTLRKMREECQAIIQENVPSDSPVVIQIDGKHYEIKQVELHNLRSSGITKLVLHPGELT